MIPYGSTSATKRELLCHHKVHKTQLDITKAYDDTLKQQILAAFHNDYVEGLVNASVVFEHTIKIELLNYL